ncbi:Stage II sporulation protein E [Lysobacter dokdonensis DS-58]|uniref:Stage II sporulation protein E n=1 Tax=Lysobacter dokdonensis DS-58 TaxID=1300345 RepID=A0A0A2X449_9GAMM|nr:ATP-binding protein [Lysobacter dokdonensis]KGQ20019.1 Stage II sporulation protein E [Lysobacter dokdonensis DS-58]
MQALHAGGMVHAVPIDDASRVGQARRLATQIAHDIGFDHDDTGRVALVATELSTNILKHAQRGELQIQAITNDGGRGIELIAVDQGPGFDFTACLHDGMSTTGTQGIGLGAVTRQAQVVDMFADARGAVVMARLHPRQRAQRDLRYGASQRAYGGEPVCGDGWAVSYNGASRIAMVVDGLGHGIAAHDAAVAAIRGFVEDHAGDPVSSMDQLHSAMSGTRGGAVAVAKFDDGPRNLRFAGIGNISAALHSLEGSRGLASHPGIVGAQYRGARAFDFPDAGGKLLILHSDGLQTRWSLSDYPGLALRHPAVVAAVLLRDFDRGRDDATVLALALGDRR